MVETSLAQMGTAMWETVEHEKVSFTRGGLPCLSTHWRKLRRDAVSYSWVNFSHDITEHSTPEQFHPHFPTRYTFHPATMQHSKPDLYVRHR